MTDPNSDPRIQFETVEQCLCGTALSPGPLWGWGICSQCGTWVNSNRPTRNSLAAVYGRTYWTTTQELVNCPPLEVRFETDMRDRIPHYLGAILPHLAPAAALAEVGCGHGRLLHELRLKGFRVTGLEFSSEIIARVVKLTDIPILQGGIERLEHESLDALISIDVLEHMHEPLEFLRAHARVLKPGGVMLVHTPVHDKPNEPYAYTVGMLWKLYHLYLFSRTLIERLFHEGGFRILAQDVRVFGWPVFVLRKR